MDRAAAAVANCSDVVAQSMCGVVAVGLAWSTQRIRRLVLVSTSGVIDVGRFGAEVAEPDRADVPNLERVVRLPDASHWVHHDEPERVSALLIDFFKR